MCVYACTYRRSPVALDDADLLGEELVEGAHQQLPGMRLEVDLHAVEQVLTGVRYQLRLVAACDVSDMVV